MLNLEGFYIGKYIAHHLKSVKIARVRVVVMQQLQYMNHESSHNEAAVPKAKAVSDDSKDLHNGLTRGKVEDERDETKGGS